MINFDSYEELLNDYGGNGFKKKVYDNGVTYMIKFPANYLKKDVLCASHSVYSEYMASKIFESLGIPVQKVELGTYTLPGAKPKVVAGCRDFTSSSAKLYEYNKLAVSTQLTNKLQPNSLENVMRVLSNSKHILHREEATELFWDMIIVDCLIGNTNRHPYSWGFLSKAAGLTLAPVYNCDSSLEAFTSPRECEKLLADNDLLEAHACGVMTAFTLTSKPLSYLTLFKEPNRDLARRIEHTVPRINMDLIHEIVWFAPDLYDSTKEVICKSMDIRKERILDNALHAIEAEQKSKRLNLFG